MRVLLRFTYEEVKKERDTYKSERDTLIADIAKLRNERDQLSKKLDEYCNTSLEIEGQLVDVSKERDEYRLKYDVLISDIAVLCEQYDNIKDKYDKLHNDLVVSKHNKFKRLYSTEIEQALKNKNLEECLFVLEKIQMDLEE